MEPGPVVTEFERKLYEDIEKMDLSGTDAETAKIFREVYLPYSNKIFTSLGQSPEEVAKVSDDIRLFDPSLPARIGAMLNCVYCFI